MSAKKPTSKATAQKKEVNDKAKWDSLGENNLMYTVNEKGYLFLRIDLNKTYKPSKSFYNDGAKRKTNILISSTGGNKALLESEFPDLRISVNIYRPMTKEEIEKWAKKN